VELGGDSGRTTQSRILEVYKEGLIIQSQNIRVVSFNRLRA
jgi:hypothetical protein